MPDDVELVARLAAGVAHSLNNLLTVISGHAQMASRTLPGDAPEHFDLDAIREATVRGAWLTRQLLAFGQPAPVDLRPCGLNSVICAVAPTMLASRPSGVSIEFDLDASVPPVITDPERLTDILLVLFTNACDAMPSGGSLVVRTDRPSSERPGFAVLRVTDSGAGIPEHLRFRIFEPFFTTHADAGRAGLGLAVVQGIVARSGATIELEATPPQGAAFAVYLPVVVDTQG